jgi:hypothetical protein
VARAPWPLEELDFSYNGLRADEAGPALAALSQHLRLRRLDLSYCRLSAASFKALVEAAWPALTSFSAQAARVEFAGPHALGAAAFARFPEFEELSLFKTQIGAAGALLLASRRWARLRNLRGAQLGDAGDAELARGRGRRSSGLTSTTTGSATS